MKRKIKKKMIKKRKNKKKLLKINNKYNNFQQIKNGVYCILQVNYFQTTQKKIKSL